MSGMNVALWPLSMKVVSAKPASPRGAGSATGESSTRVGRARSSARTAMATSFVPPSPRAAIRGAGRLVGYIVTRNLPSHYWYPQRRHLQRRGGGLRREVVRVLRERLRPVLGHEHQILDPAAAVTVSVEAGLD